MSICVLTRSHTSVKNEVRNVCPSYTANPVTLCENDAATDTYRLLFSIPAQYYLKKCYQLRLAGINDLELKHNLHLITAKKLTAYIFGCSVVECFYDTDVVIRRFLVQFFTLSPTGFVPLIKKPLISKRKIPSRILAILHLFDISRSSYRSCVVLLPQLTHKSAAL